MGRVNTNKKSVAIIALILNLGIPGLGSIIGGRNSDGYKQLVLIGIASFFNLVLPDSGFPHIVVASITASAWVWALLTSLTLLQGAFGRPSRK